MSFAALIAAAALQPKPANPFAPLSGAEMALARRVMANSGRVPATARFSDLALVEPSKDGRPQPRQAEAIFLVPAGNKVFRARVDLAAKRLTFCREVPGVQTMATDSDYATADEVVRANAEWKAAVRRRGIKDIASMHLEPWAPGPIADSNGRRLMKVLTFVRGTSRNPYARPVEGLIAVVDVLAKKILRIEDLGGPTPATDSGDYPLQPTGDLKPLVTTSPKGTSFEVKDHTVRWGNWRFAYSMQPREGLVLHRVGWADRGTVRPILHRASLAEMAVPYADPSPTWSWRSAFDVGEYGVGLLASSLQRGGDIPQQATTLDEVLPMESGMPRVLPRAVGIYERDGGVLWRHWDFVRNETVSRRARELVVCAMASIGNYDYLLSYVFRQDGSLRVEVDLTGIMLAKGVARVKESSAHASPATGHLVAPKVEAVNHQHFFCFRLDMDVDGAANNTVMEGRSAAIDSTAGNAFTMRETPLRTEEEARRDRELGSAVSWRVVNPGRRNATGWSTGYALIPGETAPALMAPTHELRTRAPFVEHNLWVTRFNPGERYPSGEFPGLNPTPGGLQTFTANNDPLVSEDVVLWYTVGVHHVPRPEDWPIMPTAKAGFSLIPVGFFDRNPTLSPSRR